MLILMYKQGRGDMPDYRFVNEGVEYNEDFGSITAGVTENLDYGLVTDPAAP